MAVFNPLATGDGIAPVTNLSPNLHRIRFDISTFLVMSAIIQLPIKAPMEKMSFKLALACAAFASLTAVPGYAQVVKIDGSSTVFLPLKVSPKTSRS